MEYQQSLVKQPQCEVLAEAPVTARHHAASHPPPLSVSEIVRILFRRKIAILSFATAIFCMSAAYTYWKTPVYEGVARLQIDPTIYTHQSNLGLDDTDKSVSMDVDNRLKTEVEIIRSNTVALQVMRSLGLYANPRFAGDDILHVTDSSQLTPMQRRRLLNRFDSSLAVRVVPSTQVIEIRFRSSDPALATDTANSIIDEYMQHNFQARIDGTAQVAQWISHQMEEIRASTTAAQQKLADFQRANNLLGTDESDNIVTDRLKQLNEELTRAEADRIVKEGRYRLAHLGDPELMSSAAPNTTLQLLHTQQADLQAQYAQLSTKFGSGYPKLGELELQIADVNAAIEAERKNVDARLANDFHAAATAEALIRQDFEQQKSEAYQLNEHVNQYAILKHEVESGQQLYDTLQLKVKEAGVTSGLSSSAVGVIDRAELPDSPVAPRRIFDLALGLGGGVFGGLLLGLLLDSFDDTIRTCEELEALTALPELGCVPMQPSFPRRNRQMLTSGTQPELADARVVPAWVSEPNSPGAEVYRSLCSMILLSTVNTPRQVLMVTSALPGEGKSTVSFNLAVALAQRGRRVLLVDADLRYSSFDTCPGSRPGLTSVLASTPLSYELFLCTRYQPLADLPNLDVLPAGFRPNSPITFLASPQMQEFMAAWRSRYEHVIVDTPPVLPFSDALVVSSLADGVILVARSEVSRKKVLLRATDVLARSGARLLGFVLNGVKYSEYHYAYPPMVGALTDGRNDCPGPWVEGGGGGLP